MVARYLGMPFQSETSRFILLFIVTMSYQNEKNKKSEVTSVMMRSAETRIQSVPNQTFLYISKYPANHVQVQHKIPAAQRPRSSLCYVLCLLFIERNAKERIIIMSGPQCCSNPPTLNPNAGAGHVEQLGGLSTYVSGSPNSKLAILLISDVFGTHTFL